MPPRKEFKIMAGGKGKRLSKKYSVYQNQCCLSIEKIERAIEILKKFV